MAPQIVGLKQAIPYLKKYRGKRFVLKIGGSLLKRESDLRNALEGVAALHHMGIQIILVHGGGPQLEELAEKLGIPQQKIAGRRVTSAETLELAKMAYGGKTNTDIVAVLHSFEVSCVGLTGLDGGTLLAHKRPPVKVADRADAPSQEVDYGFVGDIDAVDPSLIEHLLAGGQMPVFAPLAGDSKGQVLNVNADTVAQKIAVALKAEKLLIVTDAPGILRDLHDPHSLVSYADVEMIRTMKGDGLLTGGMLPKSEACVAAIEGGVKRAHIIGGGEPESLLKEIFTNEGCGTLIVGKIEKNGGTSW